jgi:hypothetical protein
MAGRQKLTGRFALTRIREGKDEAWLVVRKAGEHANTAHEPPTVVTDVLCHLVQVTVELSARGS